MNRLNKLSSGKKSSIFFSVYVYCTNEIVQIKNNISSHSCILKCKGPGLCTKTVISPFCIRCFDFPKIWTKTERRLKIERSGKHLISLYLTSSLFLFWCKEFWIITLIILPIVYILGKSKHLTQNQGGPKKRTECQPLHISKYP